MPKKMVVVRQLSRNHDPVVCNVFEADETDCTKTEEEWYLNDKADRCIAEIKKQFAEMHLAFFYKQIVD